MIGTEGKSRCGTSGCSLKVKKPYSGQLVGNFIPAKAYPGERRVVVITGRCESGMSRHGKRHFPGSQRKFSRELPNSGMRK